MCNNSPLLVAPLLVLVVSIFTGCPEEDGHNSRTQVNSRPTCEQFDQRIAQKLFLMGYGGIGMDYNFNGERVESDDSRIGRCVANLDNFATQKDLTYISNNFTPCFEKALNAKDLSRIERCLTDLKQNLGEVTFVVFIEYTLKPLLEKGRGSLNDVAGDFFKRSGWTN